MSLKEKLSRYKKHLNRPGESESKHPTAKQPILDSAIKQSADDLGADIIYLDQQYLLLKQTDIPLDDDHGQAPLSDVYNVMEQWQKVSFDHPLSAKGKQVSDLLFFDTETTGLGAGAGHMIFLLGTGVINNRCLTIKQYLLPGPGHEAAFYHQFLTDHETLDNLVTFNGKSFDWPRVKTRYQFVRHQVPRLPKFGHFDLLHASRRLWKHEMEKVRLQNVEAQKLSFERDGDVPGHMAPFLYFQFLKAPKASLIKGILEHNLNDIKSLVALYTKISHQVLGTEGYDLETTAYEVARWHASLGNVKTAITKLESTQSTIDTEIGYKSKKLLAFLYKKDKRLDEAYQVFRTLIDYDSHQDFEVCLEAAKLNEHRYRDFEAAIHYSELAFERFMQHRSTGKRDKEAIEKRLRRLYRKR